MNKVLRKIVTSATMVAVTSTLIFANSSAIIAKATITGEEVIDNKLEVEEASELQDVKANENVVYYKNSNGWAKVYAYVWAGQNQSVKWPGTEMTKVSGDVWSFKIPDGFESGSIIFNDGNSNQTDDLTVNIGKIFEGSAWSDYKGSESGGSESGGSESGGSESGGSESGGSESGGSQGGEIVDKKLPVIDKVSVEKNSDGTYTYTVNASGGETGTNLLFYKFFNANSKGKEIAINQNQGIGQNYSTSNQYTTDSEDISVHVQNSDNDEVSGIYNAEELLDNTDEPTGDFSVSLSSNPSATNQVEVGTSIKLTATAKNGQGKVNYAFIGKNGAEKFDIQESSTKQTATWTPDEAGTYTITVEAVDEKDNKSTDSLKITVKDKQDPGKEDPGTEDPTDPGKEDPGTEDPTDPGKEDPGKEDKDEITKVVVTASTTSTQVGNTIKLTAKVTGGTGTVYYRFGYIDSNGETQYISTNWQTGSTKNWKPTEEGKFKIFVEAKDDNSTKTSSNVTINVEKNGGSDKPQETSDSTNALAIGLVSLVSLAGVVSLKRKNK